ncbi:efflux pump-like protein [Elsinoe australis]|uniref:Efflux pump-like protein n=1 Tax=Elsinoe australis TaxID=40998 RepID=A0A4U7AVQ0_9PEZI|nr:efflux pump-like protein [Elsinoe australis]
MVNETTPLLAAENAGPTAQVNAEVALAREQHVHATVSPQSGDENDMPLPKIQILILCYARMVEPIAFFCIFPFLNKMIFRTATVPEADVYGRTLLGKFAIRAMFSEVSTPKTQVRAFSRFAVSGSVGTLLGPLIGGALSEPVEQYPALFGGNELFTKYPYALPSIVSGAFAVSAAVLCVFGLKETLGARDKEATSKPMSTAEILKSPGVGWTLFIYSWTTMLALGYTAVAPVFWFTNPHLGGYGLSPIQISMFLAIAGGSQTLWTLLIFPPLQKRVATGGVLKFCYAYQPFIYVLMPISSILRRNGKEVEFWCLSIFTALVRASNSMASTGIQLALNDISPSHQALGTLNAVALTIVSGIRAVAPAAFASVYAFGVGHQILGGYLIFVLIVVMAALLCAFVQWLPPKAYGKPVEKEIADSDGERERQ